MAKHDNVHIDVNTGGATAAASQRLTAEEIAQRRGMEFGQKLGKMFVALGIAASVAVFLYVLPFVWSYVTEGREAILYLSAAVVITGMIAGLPTVELIFCDEPHERQIARGAWLFAITVATGAAMTYALGNKASNPESIGMVPRALDLTNAGMDASVAEARQLVAFGLAMLVVLAAGWCIRWGYQTSTGSHRLVMGAVTRPSAAVAPAYEHRGADGPAAPIQEWWDWQVTRKPELKVQASAAYRDYALSCQGKCTPISEKKFGDIMSLIARTPGSGVEKVKIEGKHYYTGIGLVNGEAITTDFVQIEKRG